MLGGIKIAFPAERGASCFYSCLASTRRGIASLSGPPPAHRLSGHKTDKRFQDPLEVRCRGWREAYMPSGSIFWKTNLLPLAGPAREQRTNSGEITRVRVFRIGGQTITPDGQHLPTEATRAKVRHQALRLHPSLRWATPLHAVVQPHARCALRYLQAIFELSNNHLFARWLGAPRESSRGGAACVVGRMSEGNQGGSRLPRWRRAKPPPHQRPVAQGRPGG